MTAEEFAPITQRGDRQPVWWLAHYKLDSSTDDHWHSCQIVDVSMGGAGVQLLGPAPPTAGRLTVNLVVPALGGAVQLAGIVKHSRPATPGVMVGIQFVDMDYLTFDVLASLIEQPQLS